MREYVEIGIGREARKAYELSEVSVVPKRRTRSSKLVDTTWHFDAYTFDHPILSHPTDALASPEFVIEMGKLGGLGVIDAEGLWGRHADLDEAIAQVLQASEHPLIPRSDDDYKAYQEASINSTRVLQQLHAAELDRDLLTERIRQVRDSGVTVGVRVSAQNARELAPVVVAAGAEILVIQGAIVSAEHVQEGDEPLNLKEFVGTLDVPVIAGGVYDFSTATHLMRAGVAGVIVGSGVSGTAAIGVPMATAIADVAAARRAYLDETEGRYVHVIADTEFYSATEIAVALACGADAAMVGRILARAQEAPGRGAYWEPQAAHPRFPRGQVSSSFFETQHPLDVVLHGPSSEPNGGLNLVGGLRRVMAKCGYTDLKQFQKADLVVGR